MFPYKDDNPTVLTPVVTVGIIAANLAAWLLVQGAGTESTLLRSVCQLGLIPGELLGRAPLGAAIPLGRDALGHLLACPNPIGPPHFATVLTSMFMHSGWLHILGNMWFLWVFGNNIEDSMGHARFVAFYLLCGIAAAAAQTVADPRSVVPMVGASGAISGVMGAYVLLYPRVRVHTLLPLGFFVTTVVLPAYVMLGYWFVLQLLMGALGSLSPTEGGVAVWAHVGGFLCGLVLIKLFANADYLARRRAGVLILPRDV